MSPQTRQENWDTFWKSNEGSRFTRKSWSKIRITALLDQLLRPGMKVLDAGCGSGFFSAYFISRGCEVTTLDYSAEALELARKKTEGKCAAYLQENLLDPSFGTRHKGVFDLIFTDGLFEHFSEEDQQRILDNFRRAKKADGLVTTFVPNRYSWWELVRPLVMPGIHEVPFTPASIRYLHREMTLVKKGGLNVLPFALSPEKLLGSRLGMILYCFAQ